MYSILHENNVMLKLINVKKFIDTQGTKYFL